MILRFWARAIQGLINIPPLHVRPLPIVPTRDTSASCPCASRIVVLGDVYISWQLSHPCGHFRSQNQTNIHLKDPVNLAYSNDMKYHQKSRKQKQHLISLGWSLQCVGCWCVMLGRTDYILCHLAAVSKNVFQSQRSLMKMNSTVFDCARHVGLGEDSLNWSWFRWPTSDSE